MIRQRVLHDVECAWDFFCSTVKWKYSGKMKTYQFNPYTLQFDLKELMEDYNKFSEQRYEVVSFNGMDYDNPMINYILINGPIWLEQYEKQIKSGEFILQCCRELKIFSDTIINSELWWRIETFKPYKYHHNWIDLDYYRYWSKLLRKNKGISLKGIGIQLQYPVVQELPADVSSVIGPEGIAKILVYNPVHDIGILEYMDTKKFRWQGSMTSFQEMLELRYSAINDYDLPQSCTSWDAAKLGTEVLLVDYRRKYGSYGKPGPISSVPLKDIISERVEFQHPKLKNMLDNLYKATLEPGKDLEIELELEGTVYDIKEGGLHSRCDPGVVEAPSGYTYWSWDASSYYPALAGVLDCSPAHLPGFGELIFEKRMERLDLKKKGLGKSSNANLIKLALNSAVGRMKEEHSDTRDHAQFFKVTINGQLLMMKFAELLLYGGAIIDMANTDGIDFFFPTNRTEELIAICKQWEDLTNIELESDVYQTVWREHINCYMAMNDKGKVVKRKGRTFITEPDLGNSVDFLIIAKAVNAYFLEDISPSDFICDADRSIFDFCASEKVGKQFKVQWGDIPMPQRLNRYYVSRKGKIPYKSKNGRLQAIAGLKNTAVMMYNEHVEQDISKYNIDYTYYIDATQKLIDKVKGVHSQLSLF